MLIHYKVHSFTNGYSNNCSQDTLYLTQLLSNSNFDFTTLEYPKSTCLPISYRCLCTQHKQQPQNDIRMCLSWLPSFARTPQLYGINISHQGFHIKSLRTPEIQVILSRPPSSWLMSIPHQPKLITYYALAIYSCVSPFSTITS